MATHLRTLLAALCLAALCLAALPASAGAAQRSPAPSLAGRRVLFVNSYHPGYLWSDKEQRGASAVLRAAGVELQVAYMDTKRKPSDAAGRAAATRVLAEIAEFRPEVIIVADDNAQRLLVAPHLRDGPIPVVFCGVNGGLEDYGYPTRFVTGMVESADVSSLMRQLRNFTVGDRVAFLADDSPTEHIIFESYNRRFFAGRLRPYFASNFVQYLDLYLRAQEENDILLLDNNAGIADWDNAAARDFVAGHGRKPSGATMEAMAPYALITLAKVPEEQGRWAAHAALDILSGISPGAIPVSWNEQTRLLVNLDLARAANFSLPAPLLREANEILDRHRAARCVPDPESGNGTGR